MWCINPSLFKMAAKTDYENNTIETKTFILWLKLLHVVCNHKSDITVILKSLPDAQSTQCILTLNFTGVPGPVVLDNAPIVHL